MDIFITTQSYVDIASISAISTTTGGQVLEKNRFSSHYRIHLIGSPVIVLLKEYNGLKILDCISSSLIQSN